MRPLPASMPRLVEAIRKSRRRLILLDFDGTLSAIRRNPREAKLPSHTRTILERLVGREGVSIGVVTGRSLTDIRRRCQTRGIHYIANHGYEALFADGHTRRWYTLAATARIWGVEQRLRERLRRHKKLYFENKGPVLAIHYRRASRAGAAAARRVVLALSQRDKEVSIASGKKVIEIRAMPLHTKGMAVLEIVRRQGPGTWIAYFGDDVTDESVFRLLRAKAVTVLVGRPTRRFSARFYVQNPAGVAKALACLDRALA